jgi:ABC transporter substrate binding protein
LPQAQGQAGHSQAGPAFPKSRFHRDAETPQGELLVTILAGFAIERHLIKARTDDGRKRAQARGVRFGRPRKLDAEDPFWKPIHEQVRLAGRNTGIEIAPSLMVSGSNEIDAAFATMKKEGAGAVVVHGSLSTKNVAELALKHGLPAATQTRSFAEVGGLMSYGADGPDVFRKTALFVTKILQGGNPANMPVEQPTKFELIVNLITAKALGIMVPETFLVRADDVIE